MSMFSIMRFYNGKQHASHVTGKNVKQISTHFLMFAKLDHEVCLLYT